MKMRPKRIFFILLLTFFFYMGMPWLSINPAKAAVETIRITVDGTYVETDVPPFIDENSRTMVPVRFISEALGCWVGWNQQEQQVRVSRPGMVVELWIGQKTAYVNDRAREMDTTAVLREGRAMVPLRFLAETFGLKVEWKQKERTVAIQSTPPPVAPSVVTGPRLATVTGNIVNIRSGPGTDYSRLTQVKAGTQLKVLAAAGEWFQVELPGGEKGWIAGWLVELQEFTPSAGTEMKDNYAPHYTLPPDAARSALIMKNSVNVRSSPGMDSPVIAKVNLGQQLVIIGEEDGWYKVSLPDGHSGWVAGWLVAVKYDMPKEIADNRPRSTALVSRWTAGEQKREGELPQLIGVEIERSGEGVLIIVTATSPLALPSSFRLENPSRLVFDFQAHLGETSPPSPLQANQGPVAQVRLGQFDDCTVRIVADLQSPASYAMSQEPAGRSITIQIQPVKAEGKIIVIDPGHGALQDWGSSDPGAIGPSGLRERDVVRSISLQLGYILLHEGFTVIYTREGDTGLTLEERAAVASIAGAELLVSVHANASTNPSMAGTMTFYHAPRGSVPEEQLNARRALANYIQRELVNRLQRPDGGVREANFLVLRSCPIPAVLVEVAFISNPEEEKLLADPDFQRRAAEAIALGIKRYLAAH